MLDIDFSILDFIQTHLRSAVGDVIMPLISKLGNGGAIWILLAIVLCCIPKYRKTGIILVAALITDVLLCNVILKPLVARPRPFLFNSDIKLLIPPPTDFSFPSGHTAVSFTSAFTLLFSKNKLWIPSMILASLIGFSRLYLYVHYPTDVFVGVLLGLIIGILVNVAMKKVLKIKR